MEETAKLIKLIVDQDIEGLRTLDKQIAEQVITLDNTLKSLRITLSTLEKYGLSNCEEFSQISNKCENYYEDLKASTELLLKIRKALSNQKKN